MSPQIVPPRLAVFWVFPRFFPATLIHAGTVTNLSDQVPKPSRFPVPAPCPAVQRDATGSLSYVTVDMDPL